jgi:hypothetical protein
MGNNCTKTVQIFPILEYKRSNFSSSHIHKYNNDEKKHYYNNNIFQSNPDLINMVEPVAQICRLRSVDFDDSKYNTKQFVQKAIELDSKQISEMLGSEKNNKKIDEIDKIEEIDEIEELNTDNELIENILRHLMRTKIMIDGCTFDESRRNYSIVPFVYLD